MMISQELIAAIRRFFYVEHWKVGTIASELNLHPDTVKRALETERFRSCHSKPLPTDPFLDFIEQTLKQHPRLRATRLFEMLRDRGYQGDIFQLRRAVRKLRPISREAFLRLSVLPGEHYGKCRAMLRRLLVIRSFPYCRRDCSDSCFP
jgi:hypothetical protein